MNDSPEQRLRDAEKARADVLATIRRKANTVEDLGRARHRLLAILERLQRGTPSDVERHLIRMLQADVKALAVKRDIARKAREKARGRAQRLLDLIKRLRQRIEGGKVVMEDSVTVSAISRSAGAAAGYVDGIFHTWPEISGGPWPLKMSIVAVNPASDARCADVEPGCLTNDEGVAWAKRRLGQGHRPTLYTSLSNARALVAQLAAAGISRSDFDLWTAHYTYQRHVCDESCGFGMPTKADGTQYADHDGNRNVDLSWIRRGVFASH